MIIYAVVYSNYYPREINSLWFKREDADFRVSELGGNWTVCEMYVH